MLKTIITSRITWFVIGVIVTLVVVGLNPTGYKLGSTVENFPTIFVNGIRAGTNAAYIANSSGNINGTINTSNAATLSGANTLSGATTISGAATLSNTTTISGFAQVANNSGAASSTLYVASGNSSSGYQPGCLVLGDKAGATSSPVYIYATGTTITATTTKPSICR